MYLLLAICSLLVGLESVSALPFLSRTRTSTTAWGRIRGGGDTASDQQSNSDFYTAVGVQVVGLAKKKNLVQDPPFLKTLGSNFILVQGDKRILQSTTQDENVHNEKSCPSIVWDGDVAAVESLSVCCDVMVIVVVVDGSTTCTTSEKDDTKLLEDDFIKALTKGLEYRADNGMVSSLLVLLVSNKTNTSDQQLNSIKDQLMVRDLATLTPRLVANLDMLSLDDATESTTGLAASWNEILQDTSTAPQRTTSNLMEAIHFPMLLQQTYKVHGGTRVQFSAPLQQHNAMASPMTTTTKEAKAQQKSTESKEDLELAQTLETEKVAGNSKMEAQSTVEAVTNQKSTNHTPALDDEDTLMTILNSAKTQIRELELQQEELWLGFSGSGAPSLSPADSVAFGTKADRIINTFQTSVAEQLEEGMASKAQRGLWLYILPPLQKLYDQHLQYLREQCGKEYEAALELSTAEDSSLDNDEYQKVWTDAAAKVTSSFREAAQVAIPMQCRRGEALRDADFDYVPALEGLLSDMMQATENQQELLGIEPDENSDTDGSAMEGEDSGKKKRPAKWYHKVAAKVFVFLVNYGQGWLAYQAIKRAAAERDAHLPKFPLF